MTSEVYDSDLINKKRWRASVEDTIGGWCVVPEEGPATPGDGALEIASFMSKSVAEHIAYLHNTYLDECGV